MEKVILFDFFGVISSEVSPIFFKRYFNEEEAKIVKEEIMSKEETIVEEQSLFTSLKDDEDTFSTYSIYILRQEETLQTIIEKYKVTKEELEEYNDLTNIQEGCKIIIPVNDK